MSQNVIATAWSTAQVTPSYPFHDYRTTPVYPDVFTYSVNGGVVRPWEFAGWKPESLSWKTGCYVHAGLSGSGPIVYSGPDAERFLAGICVNRFDQFAPGMAKHAVMCNEYGRITGHGMLQRTAADEFRLYIHGVWASYMFGLASLDVEQHSLDEYLFQVAGPTSLETLEAATCADLHELEFMRFTSATIGGRPVEVMRIGMAGSLAYEVHGPMEDAAPIYDAIVQAGRDYDIERLGWRTYPVNHIEGGFPQQTWTFFPAVAEVGGFSEWADDHGLAMLVSPRWTGSVDPSDHRARYRTPVEVGWDRSIDLHHDFIGRAALERELADPRKRIATLVWNAEDVVDIYASLFRSGEEYAYIDLPTLSHPRVPMAHADHVVMDGIPVGVSSGTAYSYYFREMLSHGTIDIECPTGTEVIVQWGPFGGAIKHVRATVARFPYFDEQRNQNVDVAAIPSGVRSS